ncbi:MAG: type II toxin-antitoxin system RelE/ParE family toxin [Candidatus Vecturithrix sp.]|jgi:proteic killer suppression protein|nr:type II toxin-antitoxin system RelE/ParE family toxin [Candidatus Vecturithrix sp.]
MEVKFRIRKLQKQYENHKEAEKAYGAAVARRYIGRINIIKQTRNLKELMQLPRLRCHELKGDRKEQYAVNLTGYYRLIFTMTDKKLEIVCIEEVSKHYDD